MFESVTSRMRQSFGRHHGEEPPPDATTRGDQDRRPRHRKHVPAPDDGDAPMPVPLTEAQDRVALRIVRVCGSHGTEVQRLCEMGLTQGCTLFITRPGGNASPIVVQVGDSRICVNREAARHFLVQAATPTA